MFLFVCVFVSAAVSFPQRDSPFAVLAKENDIMWGGGMPDDTSGELGWETC